jgi:hypothetical protein
MKLTLLPAFSALALIGTACNARAELLVYEGFDYTADTEEADSDLFPQNGGSGFDGAYYGGGVATRPIVSGSLHYPGSVAYTPTGNSVQINTTGEFFATTSRNLGAAAGLGASTAGTRYVSFLLNSTNLQNYTQLGFAQLGGSFPPPSVTFGFEDGAFTVEAAGAGDKTLFGTAVASTTYFFLGKIVNDGTTSVASLSVFGPDDTVPGVEGTYQASTAAFPSLDLTRLFGFQGQNTSLLIDEIRVGNSYADVVFVPEPSAALSLLGGVGMILGFRRNRCVAA